MDRKSPYTAWRSLRPALAGVAAVMLAICGSSAADAANWQGKIFTVFNSSANNEAFRIEMSPTIPVCTSNFVYINASDSNYQVFVASLLSAYALGRTVVIYYDVEASGFCRLTEFSVN